MKNPNTHKTIDLNVVRNALDDMIRRCGGGDVPPRMISAKAREIGLSVTQFAEAAAHLNRPFSTNHVR